MPSTCPRRRTQAFARGVGLMPVRFFPESCWRPGSPHGRGAEVPFLLRQQNRGPGGGTCRQEPRALPGDSSPFQTLQSVLCCLWTPAVTDWLNFLGQHPHSASISALGIFSSCFFVCLLVHFPRLSPWVEAVDQMRDSLSSSGVLPGNWFCPTGRPHPTSSLKFLFSREGQAK